MDVSGTGTKYPSKEYLAKIPGVYSMDQPEINIDIYAPGGMGQQTVSEPEGSEGFELTLHRFIKFQGHQCGLAKNCLMKTSSVGNGHFMDRAKIFQNIYSTLLHRCVLLSRVRKQLSSTQERMCASDLALLTASYLR